MTAALEDTGVTYEELEDLDAEFEDVELEILRQQYKLQKPLYEKRAKIISRIPNFWPLVIEQAPEDIDTYIQPSDSALLLSSLTSLSVSRFEIENGGTGDPRSIAIRWEFGENEYFEDKVLEKKFWHRRARDGSDGLVSEPVDIRWKKGKDLTNGMLGMIKRVWDEEQRVKSAGGGGKRNKKKKEMSEEEKALRKKIENTGIGGISFFAWFGFIGARVSAEESKAATEKDALKRKLRAEGKEIEEDEDDDEEEEGGGDEEEEEEEDVEIFANGDDLAVAISSDLWPDAIDYFTEAQEQDALSDDDFESDEEEAPELVEVDEHTLQERPAKKQRT